jgi:hypothetical protein
MTATILIIYLILRKFKNDSEKIIRKIIKEELKSGKV